MGYYPDLSPYVYMPGFPGLVNVGWLDLNHPFSQGTVEPNVVSRIGELCRYPVNLMRGYHACSKCAEFPVREAYFGDGELRPLGDGEIRVRGISRTYSSPTLIYHYILRDSYLPPKEFLDAVDRLTD